jgi:hypothetical protein
MGKRRGVYGVLIGKSGGGGRDKYGSPLGIILDWIFKE